MTTSSAPTSHLSPKRKRSTPSIVSTPPRLSTNLAPLQAPQSTSSSTSIPIRAPTLQSDTPADGSPRTKVAVQFHELQLRSPTDTNHALGVTNAAGVESARSAKTTEDTLASSAIRRTPPTKSTTLAAAPFSPVSPSTASPTTKRFRTAPTTPPPPESPPSNAPRASPSKATSATKMPISNSTSASTSTSPSRRGSPPPAKLSPDETDADDGEGLNGIGFRPTPAVAYARTERRRQQILEYRAREAREARRLRSERRRGEGGAAGDKGGGMPEEGSAGEGRKVRFMEGAS
ncbi:MAG: hypothetical protein M1833_005024 [Piccolia ochrophora]|nr:MAG: hypothetical protein M1833_005024 [Piccolia ochrophora]